MKHKLFLAFVCVACAACGVAADDSGPGIPLQISLYGGTRMIQGDDRPYVLGIMYSSGSVDVMSGESFAKTGVNGGIGLSSATRMSEPLHYGLELDLQFGSLLVIGAGLGLGYNLCLSKDKMWLQPKANLSYTMTSRDLGSIPGFSGTGLFSNHLIVNGTDIYEPKVDVSSFFFVLRPEINGYIRFTEVVLGVVGLGYQLPLNSPNISFDFRGKTYGGDDTVTETIKSSSSSVILLLGGERVIKTKASPTGLVLNVGVAIEI